MLCGVTYIVPVCNLNGSVWWLAIYHEKFINFVHVGHIMQLSLAFVSNVNVIDSANSISFWRKKYE